MRIAFTSIITIVAFIIFVNFYLPKIHSASSSLVINEVLYDPEGTDTGYEWIELKNISTTPIDLNGWTLQIAGTVFTNKATLPAYIIQPDTIVLIGETLVTDAQIRLPSLAFQNGGSETDGIRILDPGGNVIDTLLYDSPNTNLLPGDISSSGVDSAPDVLSGNSLARIGKTDTDSSSTDFAECEIPSPGQINIFPPIAQISIPENGFVRDEVVLDGTDSTDPDFNSNSDIKEALSYSWTISQNNISIATLSGPTATFIFQEIGTFSILLTVTDTSNLTHSTQAEITITEDPNNPSITQISEAKSLPVGTGITIEATVTAPARILYTSDGYVQDKTAGIRVKIPSDMSLELSTLYRLSGTLSTSYGEPRLSITTATPISSQDPVQPVAISQADTPFFIGTLVTLMLHIKAKRGESLDSYEQNANSLIPVYISDLTGIDSSLFRSGITVKVTGIVSQYGIHDDGSPKIRIMPRFEDDIHTSPSTQLTVTGLSLQFTLWAFVALFIVFLHSIMTNTPSISRQ